MLTRQEKGTAEAMAWEEGEGTFAEVRAEPNRAEAAEAGEGTNGAVQGCILKSSFAGRCGELVRRGWSGGHEETSQRRLQKSG